MEHVHIHHLNLMFADIPQRHIGFKKSICTSVYFYIRSLPDIPANFTQASFPFFCLKRLHGKKYFLSLQSCLVIVEKNDQWNIFW